MKRLSLLLIFLVTFSAFALLVPTNFRTQDAHAAAPNWKPFISCLNNKATCLNPTGPASFFQGLPNSNQTSHYVFTNLGIDFWYNGQGNFSIPYFTAKWGSLSSPCLLSPNGSPVIVNASTISQSFKQSFLCGPNTVSLIIYYKQQIVNGYVSLSLKQAIQHSFSSYPATLNEVFLNPLNAQVTYDSAKHQVFFNKVGYDWSDSATGIYNTTTNTLSWNLGSSGVIDPTTIGTSTSASATSYSNQHKVWYQKNTRDWDFYSDGTNCVWRSSTDGSTWSATTTVRACTSGNRLSTWVDSSNNIYYCFADNANNNFGEADGTLNSDGTITWHSAEVTVSSSGTADTNCNIFATATTNIWISVSTINGGASRQLEIWKCTSTCGNSANWSNNLTTGGTSQVAYAIASTIIGLSTNQKMFVVWGRDDTYGTISVIDTTNGGTGWTTDSSPTNSYSMTYSGASRIGDTLHFAGLYTGGNIGYWSYPQGGAITADLTLDTTTTPNGVSISAGASTRIIVGWTDASDLFYKLSTNSGTSFGAKQTVSSTESTDQAQTLTADPTISSSTTALTWTAGAGPNYNVRFAIITVTNTFTAQSSGGNFPASSTVKVEGLSGGADTTCTITTGGLASASQSCTFDLGTPVVFNGLSSQGTSTKQWSAVPITNGLVGHWMFDENSGTSAFDASGSGNTGTLTNSPTWQTGANCKFGSCLSFASASSQYINIGSPANLQLSTLTISLWVKMSTNGATQDFVEYGTGNGYEFYINSGNTIAFSNTVSDICYGGSITDTTTWHYLVASYDGTTCAIYKDGTLVSGATTVGAFTFAGNLNFGRRTTGGQYLNGYMDDVRIYNRALSASEISELYSATIPNITFSDTTGGNTHTVTYYKSDSETVSYSVSGGGTPTAPTLNFNNIGTAQTFTLTTTGQTLWLDEATAWSTTNPTTGSTSTERWDTNTASGTPSGGGTIAPVYYHQYACTCSYTGTVASGGAPSFAGNAFGANSIVTMPSVSPATIWKDNGAAYTINKPTTDFPSPTERYETNTANGTISAAFTLAPVFYHQYLITASYSLSDGSAPSAPTLTGVRFGSASSDILTKTPSGYWEDNGATLSIPNPLSDSTTSQRWIALSGTSLTVSSASSLAPSYYHQYAISNGNSLSISRTFNGINGITSAATGWFDSGTSITATGILSSVAFGTQTAPFNLYQLGKEGFQLACGSSAASPTRTTNAITYSLASAAACQLAMPSSWSISNWFYGGVAQTITSPSGPVASVGSNSGSAEVDVSASTTPPPTGGSTGGSTGGTGGLVTVTQTATASSSVPGVNVPLPSPTGGTVTQEIPVPILLFSVGGLVGLLAVSYAVANRRTIAKEASSIDIQGATLEAAKDIKKDFTFSGSAKHRSLRFDDRRKRN